jgi:hypothetical protein
MSLLEKILAKLGLSKDKAEVSSGAGPSVRPMGRPMTPQEAEDFRSGVKGAAGGSSAPMSEVDVIQKLDSMNKDSGLNWKTSIVDLLKVLDIDSSREARNELAKELGCPADLMSDSAKMNTWLHKAVLKKIAANGGNVPKDLLD